MAATRGSLITLKIGSSLFQGLVSKNFSGQTEVEDATNQDSGGAKTHNAGDKSATIGFSSMLDPSHTNGVKQILDAWKGKTDVDFVMQGGTGDIAISGTGTITAVTLNAEHGSTASCDGTITCKGGLTFGTAPVA